MKLVIDLPEDATIGDLITVRGALSDAAMTFIDWEKVHNSQPNAISAPGVVLLEFAKQIKEQA